MKLKNINVLMLFIMFFVSCSAQQTEIQFKVIAINSNFSGAYSIDGGSYTSYAGSNIENNVYVFEKMTEIDNQIEVIAAPDSSADSLDISFYDDGDKVKTCSLSSSSTSLTCEYDISDTTSSE